MTFQELLDELAEAARSNRDKGTQFEKLIANYLLTDPQYADRLADVWLWEEWPDRWSVDVGIDLVARERGTGDYWAIQCKFFDPDYSLHQDDINSFFTTSGKKFATKEGERVIPLEAYNYVVNGKPAIEWVMERYAVSIDKSSGIKTDPNEWSTDPRYIVDLVKRIVHVSVETARIVKGLPVQAIGRQPWLH